LSHVALFYTVLHIVAAFTFSLEGVCLVTGINPVSRGLLLHNRLSCWWPSIYFFLTTDSCLQHAYQ